MTFMAIDTQPRNPELEEAKPEPEPVAPWAPNPPPGAPVIPQHGGEANAPPQGGGTPFVPEPIADASGWISMFQSWSSRIPTFDNATIVDYPPTNPTDVVTKRYVDSYMATFGVTSFNGRTGAITLLPDDLTGAGGALIDSPAFTGLPTGPTAPPGTNTTELATTEFVMNAIIDSTTGVASWNGRTGGVTMTITDITNALGYTPYDAANPAGYQTAADVQADISAALGGYALLSQVPLPSNTLPLMDGTAAPGTATLWTRGDHVHPTDTSRYAASNPAGYQTASQVTALIPQPYNSNPLMDGVAAPGSSAFWSHGDHVHPVDTSRYAANNPLGFQTAAQLAAALVPYAPLNSPTFTGTPSLPTGTTGITQVAGTADSSMATTAFVNNAILALGSLGVLVADTPPTAPDKTLWWDSVGGNLYLRYNDGNSAQWVPATNITGLANMAPLASPAFTGNPTGPTPAAGDSDTSLATTAFVQAALVPYANNVGRNLIHNPLFNVAQRGAGPWNTTASYTADRWIMSFANGTYSFSIVNLTDADRSAIGDEAATYALQGVVAGTAGTNDVAFFEQRMEGVRRFAGKTITLSFWAKSNSGTPSLGIQYLQVFGSGGSPSSVVTFPTNSTAIALNTTWTRYTTTIAVPSVAGKTFGTTPGTDIFYLRIYQSSGATAGSSIGAQSFTLQLWGVQLEIGTVATPLEKPDPQQDLAKCMRFYQTGHFSCYQAAGFNAAPFGGYAPFAVPMRAVPSQAAVVSPTYANANSANTPAQYVDGIMIQATATAASAIAVNCGWTASADL